MEIEKKSIGQYNYSKSNKIISHECVRDKSPTLSSHSFERNWYNFELTHECARDKSLTLSSHSFKMKLYKFELITSKTIGLRYEHLKLEIQNPITAIFHDRWIKQKCHFTAPMKPNHLPDDSILSSNCVIG